MRRKILGISERMLTQQLRELEDDGSVHRKVYPVLILLTVVRRVRAGS
jgi:DNA-binding HxlR family transcriptional regulator